MRRNTVQNPAHTNGYAGKRNIRAENSRTVGLGKNSFVYIPTNFAFIHIKGRNDFNVSRPISVHLIVHQPDGRLRGFSPVKMYPLYQRADTVSNPCYRDLDFVHIVTSF